MIFNRRFVSGIVFAAALMFVPLFATFAQERPRVVKPVSSRPINQPPAPTTQASQPANDDPTQPSSTVRPPLTTRIVVAEQPPPQVKKTGDSSPLNAMTKAAARRSVYSQVITNDIFTGIQARLGIPYRYGSQGPKTYDCSGFIWSVFRDAGLEFERSSARTLWANSTPVEGDERYIFGTLVFMNNLGHVGIVADENGFYHASRSKGITYSPFKGYWENRIVGFRRLNLPESQAK